MTELIGFKTQFSIAKLIQEIGSPPASIVDDRNENNAPFRRLEQCRDVKFSDARDGYCWTEMSYCSVCTGSRFRCPCPLSRAERRFSPETVCAALCTIRRNRLLQMAGSPTNIATVRVANMLAFAVSTPFEIDLDI
jgi:hypothetical protein